MAAPTKPREARRAYALFKDATDDAKLKADYPILVDRVGELARRWHALDDAEKELYEELAAEDAARYAREKAAYDDANKEKPTFVATHLPPRKPVLVRKPRGKGKHRAQKASAISLQHLAVRLKMLRLLLWRCAGGGRGSRTSRRACRGRRRRAVFYSSWARGGPPWC